MQTRCLLFDNVDHARDSHVFHIEDDVCKPGLGRHRMGKLVDFFAHTVDFAAFDRPSAVVAQLRFNPSAKLCRDGFDRLEFDVILCAA